jgi:hypothetical protein
MGNNKAQCETTRADTSADTTHIDSGKQTNE